MTVLASSWRLRAALAAGLPAVLAAFTACAQPGDRVAADGLPAWLRTRIAQYDAMPAAQAPLAIWQVQHDGKPAWFVVSPCCDQYNPLLDGEGRTICSPSGGIVGRGDGQCPRPGDRGSRVRLAWVHPRSPVPDPPVPDLVKP